MLACVRASYPNFLSFQAASPRYCRTTCHVCAHERVCVCISACVCMCVRARACVRVYGGRVGYARVRGCEACKRARAYGRELIASTDRVSGADGSPICIHDASKCNTHTHTCTHTYASMMHRNATHTHTHAHTHMHPCCIEMQRRKQAAASCARDREGEHEDDKERGREKGGKEKGRRFHLYTLAAQQP